VAQKSRRKKNNTHIRHFKENCFWFGASSSHHLNKKKNTPLIKDRGPETKAVKGLVEWEQLSNDCVYVLSSGHHYVIACVLMLRKDPLHFKQSKRFLYMRGRRREGERGREREGEGEGEKYLIIYQSDNSLHSFLSSIL
jgi:hypothetical protein